MAEVDAIAGKVAGGNTDNTACSMLAAFRAKIVDHTAQGLIKDRDTNQLLGDIDAISSALGWV